MKNSFLIILMLFSSNAFSWCWSLYLTDIPSVVNLNDDISPKTTIKSVRGSSYEDCRYRLGVDEGQNSTYNRILRNGANTINFSIAKNNSMSRILKDVIDATSSNNYYEHRYRSYRGSSSKSFKIYSELSPTGNEPPGVYSGTFNFKIYQQIGNFYFFYGQWPITYTYTIADDLKLSIVDTGSPFDEFDNSQDLNFGQLVQNSKQGFDIVIQSNSGYVLDISSQNNGKMKHLSTNSFVDYTFYVNGQPKSLQNSSSSPVIISSGYGSHPNDGFRVPIEVEVGDVENKVAGTYQDKLTITVTTNL